MDTRRTRNYKRTIGPGEKTEPTQNCQREKTEPTPNYPIAKKNKGGELMEITELTVHELQEKIKNK